MSAMPQGWVEAGFGQIADIKLGKMLDKAKNRGELTGYLRNVNVRWGTFDLDDIGQMPMSRAERDALQIKDGDLLVCEGGEPGRSAVWDQGPNEFAFQKALMRVRPHTGIDASYLASFLRRAYESGALSQHFTGTTIKHLPQATLASVRLPLPPAAEQRRIVAKIASLNGKSRRARDRLVHIPRLVEKYKQAVLAAAFRGISPNEPSRKVGDLAQFITSGSRGWAKYYSDHGSLFIRVANIMRGHIGLSLSETQFVSPPEGVEGLRTSVRPADIVVTITADLGRVALIPPDLGSAYVNQHVALVRLQDQELGPFIAWYLTSEIGQRQMLEQNRGVTRAGLGLDDIRNVTLPLPSIADQRKTVELIETAFAWIDRLACEAARARSLLDRLDRVVLAKAFQGELVSQDPDDEPASLLLNRIKAQRDAAPKAKRGRKSKAA